MHHRAGGGSMKGRESFVTAPSEREAKSEKDSFRRGGRHHGHKAHGHKAHGRADKRARGGGVTHSPFSSAAKGNDMGRHSAHKDHHQPRADGGAVGRADGGGVGAFKHGGRARRHAGIGGHMAKGGVRPSPFSKSAHNFGAHHGSGHEEPAMLHPPVHEKHGGTAHHRKTHEVHHAGHGAHHAHHEHHDGHHHGHHSGAHLHGAHKAKGHKHRGAHHRAEGGKVDDKEDGPPCGGEDDDGMKRGGRAKHHGAGGPIKIKAEHADVYETEGGEHHWKDAGDKSKIGAKRGGRK
jgi:hypothetical protein